MVLGQRTDKLKDEMEESLEQTHKHRELKSKQVRQDQSMNGAGKKPSNLQGKLMDSLLAPHSKINSDELWT